MNSYSQLKWACRRGMLELDVLLGSFLEQRYLMLSNEEQQAFTQLLSEPDPLLFAWLLGQEDVAVDPSFFHIVELIRRHARNPIRP